jgi:hypothetical protein
MGKGARPLTTQRPKIDGAFARVLGLDMGEGTKKSGDATEVAGPPEMTVGANTEPGPRIQPATEAAPSEPPGAIDAAEVVSPLRRRVTTALAVVIAIGVGAGGVALYSAVGPDGPPFEPPIAASAEGEVETGFLRLGSTPAGATVEIDGRPWDQPTPTVVEVTAGGAHHLAFRLPDHLPVEADVEAVAGETTDVDVVLDQVRGRLSVRSTPLGAEVTVDGEARGVTPLVLEDLPRARVEVAISAEGYGRYREWAPLDQMASHDIDATLEERRSFGTLDVSTTPWARVVVDGRVVAESTPVTGIRLPVGRHSVVLENPRLGLRARRSVDIRAGSAARLVVELR